MKQVESLKTPAWWQRIELILAPTGYWERAFESHPEAFWAKGVDWGSPLMMFYTPQAAQQIIENRDKHLGIVSFPGELTAIFGNNSVVTSEGDRHQILRKILMPPLHGKLVRDYGKLICDITKQVMQQLPTNQPFLAWEVAQDITLQVLIEILFGSAQKERYQHLKNLIVSLLNLFAAKTAGFPLLRFFPKILGNRNLGQKFIQTRQQIEQLIYAEIAERRTRVEPDKTDVLSLMMSFRDEQGQPLTDVEILDNLLLLLSTGNESTTAAICWSWYCVYRNPEIQEKLLQEIENLGDCSDPINLYRLPYLTAVCNETLRMYPITMFILPRGVKTSTEIAGYELQPGNIVSISNYLLHRQEYLYPAPDEFKPERFIERQFSAYEFMPFGGGIRSCIGAELALYLMKLILATIVSEYQLILADNQSVKLQTRNANLAPVGLQLVKQDC
ncbi:cytochrome P450 [Plectonema radiosum NIES-515]|uniref:Cytochrome P450 n=1 Tax=Plectonema radiosum NIES-515 TaxID=2986073 RepID=A0ABT3AX78_9CYAN|nr:cytochrome P450 [Plectonema radiosum]MCV3213330.1 cytochrome P450 [Plectonema radiosum NIES-515]